MVGMGSHLGSTILFYTVFIKLERMIILLRVYLIKVSCVMSLL